MTDASLDAAVHYAIIDAVRNVGRAPDRFTVASQLGRGVQDVERSLKRLEASHSLVLHPHVVEPWVIAPFSLSPTATWVQQGNTGWWSACIWCAFGIAALVGGDVTIHTRIGGETDDVDIHVIDGAVVEKDLVVHFAVRPQVSWDNIHHHCACILPFRMSADVEDWSARHGIAIGDVVPIEQAASLGRVWYGKHGDRDWKKCSITEARALFATVGLKGQFWELEDKAGAY
jgi:hypothetical protein